VLQGGAREVRRGQRGRLVKPTAGKPRGARPTTYAPPTPKVARQQRAEVLTAAERAEFLASRPDLAKPK
jgi:hypothetical protein